MTGILTFWQNLRLTLEYIVPRECFLLDRLLCIDISLQIFLRSCLYWLIVYWLCIAKSLEPTYYVFFISTIRSDKFWMLRFYKFPLLFFLLCWTLRRIVGSKSVANINVSLWSQRLDLSMVIGNLMWLFVF